jgi:hypothetical protein
VRTAAAILGLLVSLSVAWSGTTPYGSGSLVVVAHVDTPPLNESTLQRVYLGKVVEINGRPIIPVNLTKGNDLRRAFMEQVLTHDDDKFVAYWTVRRYIGQGTPPREFETIEQQVEFLRRTPGSVGYVQDVADLKPGLRVLLKRP